MSLHLASTFVTTPTDGTSLSGLRRAAGRLLALARRPWPGEAIRALTRSDRLSPALLRDTGLSADQIGQAPIWGHGGIMWRP